MARFSRHMRALRVLTCAAVAALAVTTTPAVAQETVPEDPQVQWSNPGSRSADPDTDVTLEILAQEPATVTAEGALDLRVRVTNNSDGELTGLQLRTQHQNALGEPDQVATSLMSNQGEYPWVGAFQQLDGSLSPGEDRQFRLTVPMDDRAGSLSGLGLSGPGVYPLLLNLNADLEGVGTSFVAATRSTVTVKGTDDTDTDDPGITMLWPLSSSSTVSAGQVGDAPEPSELYLSDESLAAELGEGGRLSGLLSSYRSAADGPGGDQLREATCLAIDPDLLETVDRMSSGYRVGPAPSPVEEPVRLRDRWTQSGEGDGSVAGTGASDAASWLDDLREIAEGHCTVPLPFAGADVNTVSELDDPWLDELSGRGAETIGDILGADAAEGVVTPGSGYLTDASLDMFGVEDDETPTTALVADSSVATADGDATVVTLPGGTRALRYSSALGSALAATGESPTTAAYSTPATRRDLDDDSAAERMAAAVGVLDLELRGDGDVLAVPPGEWTVDEAGASALLEAVTSRLDDGAVRPVSFGAALQAEASDGTLADVADPAPLTDAEVSASRELAENLHDFTGIMINDPNVVLTREVFTRPMFDDLLRSMSDDGRRVASVSDRTQTLASVRRGNVEERTGTLRASVALAPPGSVFTRTSDASPLIVVARNGLPLPVQVQVDYESSDGASLNTPGMQQIPAQGSVTWQMTTSIPSDVRETDLTMVLKTPGDMPISESVSIRIATGPGTGVVAVVIGVAVVFGLFTVVRITKRRRQLANRRGSARR